MYAYINVYTYNKNYSQYRCGLIAVDVQSIHLHFLDLSEVISDYTCL